MLVKIQPHQVKMGMFVESFEGSFFDHGFWTDGFLISKTHQLERICDSNIDAVIINTDKGIGLARAGPKNPVAISQPAKTVKASPAINSKSQQIWQSRPKNAPFGRAAPSQSFRQEAKRAAALIKKSKAVLMSQFDAARLGQAVKGNRLEPLVAEITASVDRNQFALQNLSRLKTKDEYTYMHSVAVCALMVNLARQMELDDDVVAEAGMAGLLHDIGKMAMPSTLLEKAAALNSKEMDTIRTHPKRGHQILENGSGISDAVKNACLHHHERIDGKGYPHRLKGDQISLLARMTAICDVYDAVTSNRPYKDAWGPTESLARMASWAGHFDPAILDAFIVSLGIYPKGALVKLASNRLAIVIDSLPAGEFGMRVLPFYTIARLEEIVEDEIVINDTAKSDRIIGTESPDSWYFKDWPSMKNRIMRSLQD